MFTENRRIIQLIEALEEQVQSLFYDRLQAIYLMGSLARGGFSELASDIDIGIVLFSTEIDDQDAIDKVLSQLVQDFPDVRNNVSIFWGSVDSINGKTEAGRYPPFDRLDLIEHANLLCGNDIRQELIKPTQQELEEAGIEFALGYLASEARISSFRNPHSLLQQGVVTTTKCVLFPARFLFLLETGKVAGNDVSVAYYRDHYADELAELVVQGYQWRNQGLPESSLASVEQLLKKQLIPVYLHFIECYRQALSDYGRVDLVESLDAWRAALLKD